MMNQADIFDALGKVDIYIMDQIVKQRYKNGPSILDAGCGGGRKLKWLYVNDFEIYGIDTDDEFLAFAKAEYPNYTSNFVNGNLKEHPCS